ncbi:MAG: superoxide dismutase [Chitinophagia bacterium]|nr:superoxide dismutase [Chitinophagia bacterium]
MTLELTHTLPALPYSHNALEPFIDAQTMQIHHGKHHQAYVDNLNKAVPGTAAEGKSLEDIMAIMSTLPVAIRNNGGGHYNHSLFWSILGNNGSQPSEQLSEAINAAFGSMEGLQEKMNTAGTTRFGSGWAWLSVNAEGNLQVSSTPNQDNPLMDVAEVKGTPILGIDVWEHAYYLHYQNRRPDYLKAIWSVINWDAVSALYAAAKAH